MLLVRIKTVVRSTTATATIPDTTATVHTYPQLKKEKKGSGWFLESRTRVPKAKSSIDPVFDFLFIVYSRLIRENAFPTAFVLCSPPWQHTATSPFDLFFGGASKVINRRRKFHPKIMIRGRQCITIISCFAPANTTRHNTIQYDAMHTVQCNTYGKVAAPEDG